MRQCGCRTLHVPAECWSCSVAHYWVAVWPPVLYCTVLYWVAVWPPVRSPQPGHSLWPAQHCRDSELIIRLQRRLLVTRAANDPLVFTITKKDSNRVFSRLKAKATIISRLNLVKLWFSENAFFIFFFTGRAFIIVNYIIKLVSEFQFDLRNPRKQPKM